jgi:hypothetical protein
MYSKLLVNEHNEKAGNTGVLFVLLVQVVPLDRWSLRNCYL